MNKVSTGLCIFLLQVGLLLSRQNDIQFSIGPDWLQNRSYDKKQSINQFSSQSTLTLSQTKSTSTTCLSTSQKETQKVITSQKVVESIKNFQQQAEKLVNSGSQYFQEDISSLYAIIYQAAEHGVLDHPDVNNQLMHEVVRLLVHQGKIQDGVIRRNQGCCWFDKHDIVGASLEDQIMINFMMTRIHGCTNDAVIELAQNCLHAWAQAQDAQTEEEYDAYQKIYSFCYGALYHHAQFENMAHGVDPVEKYALQGLLNECNYELDYSFKKQTSHYQRLIQRQHYLQLSLENPQLTNHTFPVSSQAVGFMMAHDINYASFQNKNCVAFQHYLSSEIVGIIESIATHAMVNHNPVLNNFLMHTCNLAVCGQQLNQQSHIEQAVALTDLCHFFEKTALFIFDDDEYSSSFYVGFASGLDRWVDFGCKLYKDPKKTMSKVIESYYEMGSACCKLFEHVHKLTVFAQIDEMTKDMYDNLRLKIPDDPSQVFDELQNKSHQRSQRNLETIKDDLQILIHATGVLVDTLSQKSLHEIFHDGGQITADVFISGKITDSLAYTTKLVAHKALQVATQLEQAIPDHLLQSPLKFIQKGDELGSVEFLKNEKK
ncbi:hypothetical protein KBC04_04185 [Candidatus Babeliales bacterium]|nr:hypothetical protein [Candidatus Babeliales bacterium]MBP9844265.1 hypothetical protein [Candidatus Babeliales bacterium]